MAYRPIMSSGDLPEGEPRPLTLDGQEVLLVRHEGAVYAMGNVCSHAYALLTDGWYEDGCVECPLHQAAFDVRTGRPTCGPATAPVPIFAVTERHGQIMLDLAIPAHIDT
ncbi:non-heme iron oxygenase ferredoxin subunit [Pigmentiphaga sp. H8]|uniref:Rieske (2Fe-2S) protein n=1 Tax=Pigmentiphaga sp. H8 TaxID=2488560 RepID=UPI000F5B7D4B|nr:non-heme iron oxygenase ferredoxin subunit [Pigmentiphaga sp. H8]AZG11160.1 non-heme iron oxygenase ferredoxin subunit [Pigmentiphaga sp. H8]